MDLSDQEKALIESVAKELDGKFEGVAAKMEEAMSSPLIEGSSDASAERFGFDLQTASHVATIASLVVAVVQQLRQPSHLQVARESIEQFLDYLMDSPEVPTKARRLPASEMRKVVTEVLKNKGD